MSENDIEKLKAAIIERLCRVIDPETGADVVRMRLVEGLEVGEGGRVSYTFRPSSPVCPLAVVLVQQIKLAVSEVSGVKSQRITVDGYVGARELTALINDEQD
jgi:metal-sulfur cluster biosynthetic enzyme